MKAAATILILFFISIWTKGIPQSLETTVAIASIKNPGYTNIVTKEGSSTSAYSIEEWIKNKKATRTVLGYSKGGRAVEAYYFPGTSDKKALIIGGVHGSELSAIEIAKNLIQTLSDSIAPYYNVVIIPVLFPDNAEKASLIKQTTGNFGRYTEEESVDPNRQMPELGKAFNEVQPFDMYGREIEKENQYLLRIIQEYNPSRIVNLHAIKDVMKGGIYADPRTDCKGFALGFESDSSLAVSMATFIESNGGKVPGNNLNCSPTALYYHDPEIAEKGFSQKRNLHGSPLPGNRGYGVSLGAWATTSVCDETKSREAARLITVEFPGYKPSLFYEGKQKEQCQLNIQLYTSAIRKIFLEKNFVE